MTSEDQEKIIELFQSGWSVRKIEAHTGHSRSSVQRIVAVAGVKRDEVVNASSDKPSDAINMMRSTPLARPSLVTLGETVMAIVCLIVLVLVFHPLLSFRSH